MKQGKDSTTLNPTSVDQLLLPLSAIAESQAISKKTTLKGKSSLCKKNTRKLKSSKTSAVGLTSSEKVYEPYWTGLCEEVSSRLLLPVEIDLQGLDSSLFSTSLNRTTEKSWFSTKQYIAQSPNLQPIFSPSFMSSVAECTDYGSTVKRSRKIKLCLNPNQRTKVRQWFGVSRLVFNKTVEYLQEPNTKANWKAIKTELLNDLPEFCKAVPYQIKSIAIKDACIAVKAAKKKFKQTGQIQKVKFRSRKNPSQSCYIPKPAVKQKGVYHTILGDISYRESLPSEFGDCRLSSYGGNFYLAIPEEIATTKTDNQGRVVAIDPGVRTFLSYLSETSVGKVGEGDFSRIQRLCFYLDDLISRTSKAKSSAKRRMKKAASRIRIKIKNLIDELHHKAARFLVDNFDVILLPTFETSKMSLKSRRKIRSKTVRSMLTFSHYRFKQFLKHKAFETGKLVLDVCEAYTSKTVSWTGELRKIGGAKKIKSNIDGQVMDRDLNGARGIFLRALGDIPWMRKHLAFNSEHVNER